MEEKTMEAQEVMENETKAEKVPLKKRVANARPVRFVRRHAKGVAAGVVGAAAVGAAAVLAVKAVTQNAGGATEIIEGAVDDVVEAVTDAVE